MKLKGLLKCTISCCVQTEQTRAVQLCILMPLTSQVRLAKKSRQTLLQQLCHFPHALLISAFEITTVMSGGCHQTQQAYHIIVILLLDLHN